MRRMKIDAIRNDPDWNNGNYTQPRAIQAASVFYGIATGGGTRTHQQMAPTREKADKLLDQRERACSQRGLRFAWVSSHAESQRPILDFQSFDFSKTSLSVGGAQWRRET